MKILVAIASYSTINDAYLQQMVAEYKSMSFSVEIVVFSNLPKYVADGVEVVVVNGLGEDPCALPFAHKKLFADRLESNDIFIYSEDDMLLSEAGIRSFLELSPYLADDEIAGFLRFERGADGLLNYPDIHGHYHWDPSSVRSRGPYTLAFFTNEHAACYVMTRDQLRKAIASGGFLVAPHSSKYDLICTAATDPYTQCGFTKLVCVSHLEEFLIHHLSNRYVGTRFGVGEAELSRQVDTLLRLASERDKAVTLFNTETSLPNGWYSKAYYEAAQIDAIGAIPSEARTILSIGCGWGATEKWLAAKGLRVTGIPLDPLIANGMEGRGIEIISGDFGEALGKLAGRQFDCVFLSNVLHLVSNPAEVLSSCAAVLAPGGVCVALIPNTGRLSTAWKAYRCPGRPGRLSNTWRALLWGHASATESDSKTRRIFPWGSGKRQKGSRTADRATTPDLQVASRRAIQKWFQQSELHLESLTNVLHSLQQRLSTYGFGLLDVWLASEFIAVARSIRNTRDDQANSRGAQETTDMEVTGALLREHK